VVATDRDQLLFYQLKKRSSSTSATSFILPSAFNGAEGIYRLKHDPRNTKKMLNGQMPPDTSLSDQIPALTMFSFGKLDLSSIGISCLMAAEEELVVGARNGDMYGVFWDGNVDDKFPWSLSKDVQVRGDYLADMKFSSVLSGFAFVFKSGRAGFMPSRLKRVAPEDDVDGKTAGVSDSETDINYLSNTDDAVCVEINHRHRLVAFGCKNSQVIVCNIDENDSGLVVNHILELRSIEVPHNITRLGSIKSMSYSPDSAALAVSWSGSDFAIWSVYGSLLFCSQQWQLECDNNGPIKPMQVRSLAWGREGYNLWLCSKVEPAISDDLSESVMTESMTISSIDDSQSKEAPNVLQNGSNRKSSVVSRALSGVDKLNGPLLQDRVFIMSLARSNLSSSPHSSCSTDSIVLMSEEKIFVGPSVPHDDKFDHWIIIDVAQDYIRSQYPIRYATVDRECNNLAVSGAKGIAIYNMTTSKWRLPAVSKKAPQPLFSVCGDLIWWHNYVIASCFNFTTKSFEIRALKVSLLDDDQCSDDFVVQPTPSEIVRMSIFENRLLVLYIDGTLGMFMLSLRRKPTSQRKKRLGPANHSTVSFVSKDRQAQLEKDPSAEQETANSLASLSIRSNRSNSVVSCSFSLQDRTSTVLQISTIENLIISNLQANSYCISSIALTRMHFKNTRIDDSILLNACGKLFLLEREARPEDPAIVAPTKGLGDLSELHKIENGDRNFSSESSFSDGNSSMAPSVVDEAITVNSPKSRVNSAHLASASLRATFPGRNSNALSNVTFKAVSVIATNVEQFWISPEISTASGKSYFTRSLWFLCGHQKSPNHQQVHNNGRRLQVWLPLLNDENDPPNDLYVPDRIMLPVRCDIYPLAIRSSSMNHAYQFGYQSDQTLTQAPDDAIVLGAESDILHKDGTIFSHFPYSTVKRQCRIYLHRILRELLLSQHLGYYAKKIAEGCQSLPYFAHCFELLLHEVLEEEATSPVPLPDPMLPQVVKFIKQFPNVYLETVVHCARKSELSMWSHLFDERAVGNPRRLFQECLERQKLDTATSCLIILQSLDRNIVSSRMVKELIRAVRESENFQYLLKDLESFLSRAELDIRNLNDSPISNQ